MGRGTEQAPANRPYWVTVDEDLAAYTRAHWDTCGRVENGPTYYALNEIFDEPPRKRRLR
ncbi:hypothetical protein BH09ACT7_BH09ACT7_60290 [soil metagenome]